MKKNLITFFFSSLYFLSFAQTKDTVKIYSYVYWKIDWKLELYKKDSFYFAFNSPVFDGYLTLTGKYNINDTTINFICDTVDNTNKKIILRDSIYSKFIKDFANGKNFKMIDGYFLPFEFTQKTDTLQGAYYRSDGAYFSDKIELKEKNNFVITESNCTSNFIQKGKYSIDKNSITLKVKSKIKRILPSISDSNQFYRYKNYLISKKINPGSENISSDYEKQVYFYLSK